MSEQDLLDVPLSERVELVERIRRGIHEIRVADGGPEVDDLVLPDESLAWVVRLRRALVDESVSQASFRELQRAFGDYLMTLSPLEAGEANRRVREFDETKQAIIEVTG